MSDKDGSAEVASAATHHMVHLNEQKTTTIDVSSNHREGEDNRAVGWRAAGSAAAIRGLPSRATVMWDFSRRTR